MFESNVQCQFINGSKVITEKLFGFPFLSDDEVVTTDSVVVGFDCGSPPEPAVSYNYVFIIIVVSDIIISP